MNGKSAKKHSNSRERTMKLLLKSFHEFFTNLPNTRSQKNEHSKWCLSFDQNEYNI